MEKVLKKLLHKPFVEHKAAKGRFSLRPEAGVQKSDRQPHVRIKEEDKLLYINHTEAEL